MRRWKKRLAGLLACAMLGAALAAPASAKTFRDVPAGNWAAGYIAQAVSAGLMEGESADYFGMGHPMTRGRFAMALCRLLGWEEVSPEKGSFTDNQDPSAPWYAAVETALANGAVTRQAESFRPEDPLTREELAVMLVRALGFGPIAGLELGIECPFQDVKTNPGYITLASQAGIAGGTGEDTFSPNDVATREQAAAMLARIMEKLDGYEPEKIGIVGAGENRPDYGGCAAVAVSTARITAFGAVTGSDEPEEAKTRAAAVRAAGGLALLRLVSAEQGVSAEPESVSAAAIREAAEFDGVLLEAPGLSGGEARDAYTGLARQLKAALGEKALYVTADIPALGQESFYDCAALCEAADRLILRAASWSETVNGFPTQPQEPLEEVYRGLAAISGTVDMAKCSIWITTTGASWDSKSGNSVPIRADRIQELLSRPDAELYYSTRYANAYLTCTEERVDRVVWFHDTRSASTRTLLAACFGAKGVCLSDVGSLAACGFASAS